MPFGRLFRSKSSRDESTSTTAAAAAASLSSGRQQQQQQEQEQQGGTNSNNNKKSTPAERRRARSRSKSRSRNSFLSRGRSCTSVTSSSNGNNSNNNDRGGSGRSSNSRGRSRSRSKSRNTASRGTSRDSRASSVNSRTSNASGRSRGSSAASTASRHMLRSKSPSRARIEQFMDEIKAHEEAVARKRIEMALSTTVGTTAKTTTNTKPTHKKSPSASNVIINNERQKVIRRNASGGIIGATAAAAPIKKSPTSCNGSITLQKIATGRDQQQQRGRSTENERGRPSLQAKKLSSKSMISEKQQQQQRGRSTERGRPRLQAKKVSSKSMVTEKKQQQQPAQRERSLSQERLALFVADRNFESSNAGMSISQNGKLTIGHSSSGDGDDFSSSSSSEEESITMVTTPFKRQPMTTTKNGKLSSSSSSPTSPTAVSLRTKSFRSAAPGSVNNSPQTTIPSTVVLSASPTSGTNHHHPKSNSIRDDGNGGIESRPVTTTPPKIDMSSRKSTSVANPTYTPPQQEKQRLIYGTKKDSPNAWHAAISKRDWVDVELLMQCYDKKRYLLPQDENDDNVVVFEGAGGGKNGIRKKKKKLRVLKYLPGGGGGRNGFENRSDDGNCSDDDDDLNEDDYEEDISPLMYLDMKGCTPLHLACKECMPLKLLQKLLLLERDAASVQDNDGRLPLHLAIIANMSPQPILDKLIRADPNVLQCPDIMKKTPLAYAILRANHNCQPTAEMEDKNYYDWGCSKSKEHSDWQHRQGEGWTTVTFLLKTLVSRGLEISYEYESYLLSQAVDCYAPPSIMKAMMSASVKIIQQEDGPRILLELVPKLVKKNYSIATFQKLVKLCTSSGIKDEKTIALFRVAMRAHYEEGCKTAKPKNGGSKKRSLPKEILVSRQTGADATESAQEWWTKLCFLISVGRGSLEDPLTLADDFVLHAALTIPESPTSLIEFLVRMFPQARYQRDPFTEALPIHLACRYWGNNNQLWAARGTTNSDKSQQEGCNVLNLLLGGDFTLAWKRYKRRIPLHYAVLSGKPLKYIQTLIQIDRKTVNAKDIKSELFPFQLAALPRSQQKKQLVSMKYAEVNQVETIYELLKMNPIGVCPKMALGSGDPKGDVGSVARHVLNWCYRYKRGGSDTGWLMNKKHVQSLRGAISTGEMEPTLEKWWGDLKRKIWNVYDRQNVGKMVSYMPRQDNFLLHAALYNGKTPPIVIELLLELYPDAVSTRAPGTDRYPLHIAARSPSYHPLPFEGVVSMSSALEMILLVYPNALYKKSEGRTVLQIAVESGKTRDEISHLHHQHPAMLTVTDRNTGLYPFQQMASIESSMPSHALIRDKTSTIKWNERSTEDNARLIRGFQVVYQRDKLSSTYEMLRAKPEVIANVLGYGSFVDGSFQWKI